MKAHKVEITMGLRRLSTLLGYPEKFCNDYFFFNKEDANAKATELRNELYKEYGGFSGIDVNVKTIEIH